MSPYPIRPITESEFEAFHLVNQHAFHGSPLIPAVRPGVLSRFEWDRSLAAFEGNSPVGITSIFSFHFTIPGAMVPAAGVSWVGVLPSHRRRGVLRGLMRRQLADIAAAGREPLAVLWASEAGIYGRYGYGRASWQLSFTVHRGEAVLNAAADGLRMSLPAPAAARTMLAKVYDTVLPVRPGFFARDDRWWDKVLEDPEEQRRGAGPLRCVVASDDSGPRGYALYRGTPQWEDETFLPDSALEITELVADSPQAGAALWRDLLTRDLTTTFRAFLRPADDPLLFQLADPRRARPTLADGLWVRLIDVGAALSARQYSVPVDLVIAVTDRELPSNEGRWRLRTSSASGTGSFTAACTSTADPADVELDIAELGASYLGGPRLGTLAGAGLVRELRPGAVRALCAAMSWDPAPWCPMIF